MTDFTEVKNHIDAKAKEQFDLTNALRDAVEAKADASTVKALEEKLNAMETANARPGAMKANSDVKAMEVKSKFNAFLRNPNDHTKAELKAMSTIDGPSGGFSVPSVIAQMIIEAPVEVSVMRSISSVETISTPNYTRLIEVSGAGYEYVRQGGTRTATDTPVFQEVSPTLAIIAAKAPITLEAMEDPQHDLAAFITRSLATRFAEAEGKDFIAGRGEAEGEPLGLLVDPRLTTVNSAGGLGLNADRLLDLTAEVHSTYHNGAVYLMNRKTKNAISKMKNSNGDYIVTNSPVAGVASTLWGYPIVIDDNMPDVGTGATPIVFGNFKAGFLVVDRVGMSIMPDPYTSLGYVNFIARKRFGSAVLDARALKGLRITA